MGKTMYDCMRTASSPEMGVRGTPGMTETFSPGGIGLSVPKAGRSVLLLPLPAPETPGPHNIFFPLE